MSKVCTLAGTVIQGRPEFYEEINGEKFYTISVNFRDTIIPVLFSEHRKEEKFKGMVEVTGCVISDKPKHSLPKFHIYANNIVSVDLDTPASNTVAFTGRVTKVGDLINNSRGIDILPLTLADSSPLGTTSVLYVCLRNKDARRLKNIETGVQISGKGYLKAYKDVYEIIAIQLDTEG